MRGKTILIVEDDEKLRRTLKLEFEELGYRVWEASASTDLPSIQIDYALVDLRLKNESGLDVLSLILASSPYAKVVVMLSGYGNIPTAVEATKRGAVDFLIKPVGLEQLLKAFSIDETSDLPFPAPLTLDQKEAEYIDYILLRNHGNISKTARDLGLHRQSLQRKLKKIVSP